MPRWYTVQITETNIHRFRIEADDEEDAKEQAVELATESAWDQGTDVSCERDVEIIE